MNRVEIETKLNEGRNWLLAKYETLSDDQLSDRSPRASTIPRIAGPRSTTSPTSR